jgi:hypothetical protein
MLGSVSRPNESCLREGFRHSFAAFVQGCQSEAVFQTKSEWQYIAKL